MRNIINAVRRISKANRLLLIIIIEIILLSVLYIGMYIRWGVGHIIGEASWYIPMMHSFTALSAFSVGFLALGRYKVLKDHISYWIGVGFTSYGIISIFFILTWPGLVESNRGIIAQLPSTSAWMTFWELVSLGLSLIMPGLSLKQAWIERFGLWSVVIWLVIVTLVAILFIIYEYNLPKLVDSNGNALARSIRGLLFFLAIFVIGTILSIRYYHKTKDTLIGYVAMNQVAISFVIITTLIGAKRYDVWFYLNRIILSGGFLAMMFGLLSEYVDLFLREKKRAVEAKHLAEELARSNIELERFAYVVSHDLKEPLRTVHGFTEILANRYKGKLDSDADEFIEFIVTGTARMSQMIQDILEYSRISTQGQPFRSVNLEDTFNQVITNLKATIDETQAQISHDHLPIIIAEPAQMMQLFQNLIANAIKFRKIEEIPHIHVSVEKKENKWLFSVKDNGIGISPEFMKRIFTIFQREHSVDEYPGTGIGLAICKKIVERHGGKIWIDSHVNIGTTFYFDIEMEKENIENGQL